MKATDQEFADARKLLYLVEQWFSDPNRAVGVLAILAVNIARQHEMPRETVQALFAAAMEGLDR